MAESVAPEQIEAALTVVRKADALRLIEKGELHRALGLGAVLPSDLAAARAALDSALAEYERIRHASPSVHP